MWFNELMGFHESDPAQVRSQLDFQDGVLHSQVNGKRYVAGKLEVVSLADLRLRTQSIDLAGELSFQERIADVKALHADKANASALFQVASQFNLLEMISPSVSPEAGVDRYESDFTQGPACAIACGAGTIYRNYLVPVDGRQGQSESHQIDCLDQIGLAMGNEDGRLWRMQNGYVIPRERGLKTITSMLREMPSEELEMIKSQLKVGVQWQSQVTLYGCKHLVSQIYCSALPVSYNKMPVDDWALFASLILEAAYEATFHAALINMARHGNQDVYLTMLGGGAFGNRAIWIVNAIEKAVKQFQNYGLNVILVSYINSNKRLFTLID